MRQMRHILAKDIRGLWGELAVFLGSLILASWSFTLASSGSGVSSWPLFSNQEVEGWAGEALVLIAGCFLIARLVHAETIPGSSQFWLTRPYRWPALLGAKVLYVLAFFHLPVFAAQAALLWNAGFPVWANLPGLLWMQVLALACVSLPAIAIAAVTRGLPGFVLFIIGGLAMAQALVYLRILSAGEMPLYSLGFYGSGAFVWVSYAVVVATLVAAALPVLYTQYSRRRTSLSRILLGAVFLFGIVVTLFGGSTLTWTIQMLASPRRLDTTSFQVSLGAPTWLAAMNSGAFSPTWPPPSFEGVQVDMHLPLVITGVPSGMELGTDNVSLSFETADGETSRPEWVWVSPFFLNRRERLRSAGTERQFELNLRITDGKFYERLAKKPGTARGYIDLFVIGNSRSIRVPKTAFPVNVTPAFRCGLENIRPGLPFSKDLKCRVAFRWPLQSIAVGQDPWPFVATESFSPFPASLRLNPIVDRQPAFGLSQPDADVEFTLQEPVSFVRKEFEIRDVRLDDGPLIERAGARGQRGRGAQ